MKLARLPLGRGVPGRPRCPGAPHSGPEVPAAVRPNGDGVGERPQQVHCLLPAGVRAVRLHLRVPTLGPRSIIVFEWKNEAGEEVRKRLLKVVESKRTNSSLPCTVLGEPSKSRYRSALEPDPCSTHSRNIDGGTPNRRTPNGNDLLEFEQEKFRLLTEDGEQGRVPVLLLKLREDPGPAKRPVVILLHSTGQTKEAMRPLMESFGARGYLAAAMDARYHGERESSPEAYTRALLRAWDTGAELPFVFDNVWDLTKLVDHLATRPDADCGRVAVVGISLGGMEAWFAAVADPRIGVVVPILGAQSFEWAVRNDAWRPRVETIAEVFEAARRQLGKDEVDSDTVGSVWRRIAPGVMDDFDAARSIPALAPRPLLILNGREDGRCPVRGLAAALEKAEEVYARAGASENFRFRAEEGVGHAVTGSMLREAIVWIDGHLRPEVRPTRAPSALEMEKLSELPLV